MSEQCPVCGAKLNAAGLCPYCLATPADEPQAQPNKATVDRQWLKRMADAEPQHGLTAGGHEPPQAAVRAAKILVEKAYPHYVNDHPTNKTWIKEQTLDFARIIANEYEGVREALELFVRWDDEEKNAKPYAEDNGQGFYRRANMCRDAFKLAKAALARLDGGG